MYVYKKQRQLLRVTWVYQKEHPPTADFGVVMMDTGVGVMDIFYFLYKKLDDS